MAVDVAPALQEQIMTRLRSGLRNNREFSRLCDRLASGVANFEDAHRVSQIAGEEATTALQAVLRPEVLPDRRLYYNIAERTLGVAMEYIDGITADYTMALQSELYNIAGLNIKPIKPRLNTEGIKNICGLASDYEDFADGEWVLGAPVQTHTETVVDRSVRANAYFAEAAGIKSVVVRTAEPECCEWCADLEGTYDYSEVRAAGSDVYRRHNKCKCVVEWYPGEGNRVQNVHMSHKSEDSWRYFRDPAN